MPRLRRKLPALLLAALLIAAGQPPAPALAEGPSEAEQALQEGLELARHPGALQQAVKRLKRADRLAPGGSYTARLALARCYSGFDRLDDQIEAAESALDIAETPPERVAAKRELAVGLARRARTARGRKGLRDLEAADRALREAIEEAGTHAPPVLLYERAVVLLRLERDPEAASLLEEFLRAAPGSELAAKARDYLERPERARLDILPSLELTTVEGERITGASLVGQVVVLDFWATWCLPCHDSLPTLEALHRMGEESGLLTVVSISPETAKTVRGFSAKHGMDWVLAVDEDNAAARSLEVRGLPTIILADHEGRVLSRRVGWSSGSGDDLLYEARRAIDQARKAAG